MKTWLPLKGIRVLSFELAFALPAGTRALHDLGAEVVRVVPPARDVNPYVGVLDGVFQGKSCIAIDLTKDEGAELAQQLACKADILCSNFRPHVLQKYGLGPSEMRKRQPRLITLQLSGYGTPGPYADYPAFGPSTEAAGGLNRLLVDEGEVPIRIGSAVFSDQLAGRYAALAVTAALKRRNNTGRGQAIDLSMTAGISHMLGQPITEALRSGQTPPAARNRDRRFVPQGVYRCAGEDEWLAISVATDKQWRTLYNLFAPVDLEADVDDRLRETSAEERWQQHDQIDALLTAFCNAHSKDALAERLQALGIPAAPVRTTADQAEDPNINARQMLQRIAHPLARHETHARPHPQLPWRIVGQSRRRLTRNHSPGEDNARVLADWLQLSPDRIAQLHRQQVLQFAGENEPGEVR